jgi:2-keto-4-pentenoate hydratase/2-oxohepta-3-ene-1,7-dioic acid hydratase in catechol pathway
MLSELPGLPQLKPGSIYCIGRNYAEHARELNNPIPAEPVVFLKPASSLLAHGGSVVIPPDSANVHHEAELVVAIGKTAFQIPPEQAHNHIAGIAAGIDITARDIQDRLKQKSLPWLLAKGLDTFAPVGPFIPLTDSVDLKNLQITLTVNNTLKQDGNTCDMLFPVDIIISRLSHWFTLMPGDLIFTGTPAGVGPLSAGDSVTSRLGSDLSVVTVNVIKK